MTKEELKQEAEESFEQYKVTDEDYVVSPYSDDMGEKMLMFNYEYEAEETYLRLYTQGYLAGAEPREKRIAELKEDNSEWEKTSDKWKSVYELTNNQLTNAKELLERLLITSCNSDVLNLLPNCSEVLRVRVEAEQFLKDCEVEK